MDKKKTNKVAMEIEVTDREKELVSLLTEGRTASRMAIKLNTTESLLSSELATIRAKFDCNNSTQLVALFLRNNLID